MSKFDKIPYYSYLYDKETGKHKVWCCGIEVEEKSNGDKMFVIDGQKWLIPKDLLFTTKQYAQKSCDYYNKKNNK